MSKREELTDVFVHGDRDSLAIGLVSESDDRTVSVISFTCQL